MYEAVSPHKNVVSLGRTPAGPLRKDISWATIQSGAIVRSLGYHWELHGTCVIETQQTASALLLKD